jgi:quercetin dioxygenase-like cupin family protein
MVPLALPPRNFTHGDIVRWRRVGGLVLAEVRYEPGQRIQRHTHPHARFVLVLSGSLTEVRGGEAAT